MSILAKKEENGKKGEARTNAVLLDSFWVFTRSVDVEGADFLVQIPADTLEELREKTYKIQVLGMIQAKYFEGNNQVKILKKYVEDSMGIPRTEFFAMLHTNDKECEDVHYFFSATEIQTEFYRDLNDEYYRFSITQDRDYANFKNKRKKDILSKIKNGILNTEEDRNLEFIKIIYMHFLQKNIIPIEISPTKKIIETYYETHEIEQKDNIVEITKTSKTTGTKTIVSSSIGNIKNIDYDPFTSTIH